MLDISRLELAAQTLFGTPWVDGSLDVRVGLDCWGFVWHLYEACGVMLPRDPFAARPLFALVTAPGAPGDILRFWAPGAPREHLGVRLPGLRFADCNRHVGGVAIHDLRLALWQRCLTDVSHYHGADA